MVLVSDLISTLNYAYDLDPDWLLVVGNPTGDVLIFVHKKGSILTQYLTWFGKPPTSMEKEPILLEIDRKRVTTHMQ